MARNLFFVILATVGFLGQSQAACDCQNACSPQVFTAAIQLCSQEDAVRCGGTIQSYLTSSQPAANNPRAREFVEALSSQRQTLIRLYPGMVNDQQYTRLAAMAFAILGNESTFYQGSRYSVKSNLPESFISIARCVARRCSADELSRGPTQIKNFPERVATHYGITNRTIYSNPTHAATATMGFLIEMRSQMSALKAKYPTALANMTDENMIDYMAYFYQGKGRLILAGNAPDPQSNVYLRNVERHLASLQIQQLSCNTSTPPTVATVRQ